MDCIQMQEQFQSTLSSQRVTIPDTVEHPAIPISIHTLLAESDEAHLYDKTAIAEFQSTLSSQRVTNGKVNAKMLYKFQSTLSSQRVTVWRVTLI